MLLGILIQAVKRQRLPILGENDNKGINAFYAVTNVLNDLMKSYPYMYNAYYWYGRLLLLIGEITSARCCFERCQQITPGIQLNKELIQCDGPQKILINAIDKDKLPQIKENIESNVTKVVLDINNKTQITVKPYNQQNISSFWSDRSSVTHETLVNSNNVKSDSVHGQESSLKYTK